MRRYARTLVGAFALTGLLAGCADDASVARYRPPETYATLEQLVADADAVALVQAGDSAVDVVERVPHTRTEVELRKVLLGEVAHDDRLTVSQVGSVVAPPGAGMPSLLQDGHEYVVVLHGTGAGSFEIVGPGVWRADTLGATLTLHTPRTASVPTPIPHVTTPPELELRLAAVRTALGTSVIGTY